MKLISVTDMLKQMDQWEKSCERQVFSIEWVTCDRKKGTGGEKIFLAQAVLVGSGKSKSAKRNPNHHKNYTRNIRALDSDRILKIHPLLVTKFNGKQITL